MKYSEILAVARLHHNVVTRNEVLQVVDVRTLQRWKSRGLLVEIAPQVYSAEPNPDWRAKVQACWFSHPELVLSHRSAARHWEIAPFATDEIEFLRPLNTHLHLACTLHASNFLPDFHIIFRDDIKVTRPSRTIVDLSAVCHANALDRAITKALDKRLTTVAEIRRCRESMAAKGRRRTNLLDEVLAKPKYASDGCRSELERQALAMLRQLELPLPVSQHAIPLKTMTLHPDFCYPDIKLAIELDGFASHGDFSSFHEDRRRDAELTINGWTVLRFSHQTLNLMPSAISSFLQRAKAG